MPSPSHHSISPLPPPLPPLPCRPATTRPRRLCWTRLMQLATLFVSSRCAPCPTSRFPFGTPITRLRGCAGGREGEEDPGHPLCLLLSLLFGGALIAVVGLCLISRPHDSGMHWGGGGCREWRRVRRALRLLHKCSVSCLSCTRVSSVAGCSLLQLRQLRACICSV
jgi:hypothetical protein